jgi:hypothetical protein
MSSSLISPGDQVGQLDPELAQLHSPEPDPLATLFAPYHDLS